MTHDWLAEAACRDADLEVFFPVVSQGRHVDWTEARQVCASCTVVDACAEYAAAGGIREGMFAGMTPDERRAHSSATEGPGRSFIRE